MTEEQIQYLKDNDIPYVPSLFKYCNYNFRKYLAILKLCAYRAFKWEDSEFLEEGAKEWVERICNDD